MTEIKQHAAVHVDAHPACRGLELQRVCETCGYRESAADIEDELDRLRDRLGTASMKHKEDAIQIVAQIHELEKLRAELADAREVARELALSWMSGAKLPMVTGDTLAKALAYPAKKEGV